MSIVSKPVIRDTIWYRCYLNWSMVGRVKKCGKKGIPIVCVHTMSERTAIWRPSFNPNLIQRSSRSPVAEVSWLQVSNVTVSLSTSAVSPRIISFLRTGVVDSFKLKILLVIETQYLGNPTDQCQQVRIETATLFVTGVDYQSLVATSVDCLIPSWLTHGSFTVFLDVFLMCSDWSLLLCYIVLLIDIGYVWTSEHSKTKLTMELTFWRKIKPST